MGRISLENLYNVERSLLLQLALKRQLFIGLHLILHRTIGLNGLYWTANPNTNPSP